MGEVDIALNYKVLWASMIMFVMICVAIVAVAIKATIDNVSPKNNTIANTSGIKQATA